MDLRELMSVEEDNDVDEDFFKLDKRSPFIVDEIEKLKMEAILLLSEEKNLDSWYKESTDILNDASNLLAEVDESSKVISNDILVNLMDSSTDFNTVAQNILDIESVLNIITQLVESDQYLKKIEVFRRSNDLYNAVLALIKFTEYLNNPADGLISLSLYKTIKSTVVLYWDQVLEDLSCSWKKILSWTEYTENKVKKVVVTVQKKDAKHYEDVLKAFDASKQFHTEIKKFSNFVLKHLLFPIIHQDTTIITESNDCPNMTLIISLKSKGRPNYENVLGNITSVFSFIKENLEYIMPLSGSLMRQLGDIISAEFCDVLVEHCLVLTIPNCTSELQEYNKVTSEVETFQEFLSDINFFASDNVSILQYANNIDVLFAEKTSQYFLEKAREIIKKDLGDTIIVGIEVIPEDDESVTFEPSLDDIIGGFVDYFPNTTFYFPKCCVSSGVQELIDLIFVAMEQASQGTDLCASRFYYTARYIIELYDAVVPKFHETLLESMPKIVGVFHNNCMYLAHKLLTLGVIWQTRLEGREYNYTISFVDHIQKLRDLGCKQLLQHMQAQKKQILETIRASDLSCIGVNDLLGDNAEQAVRHCLRQLQVLKTLWIGIFPPNVYSKLISLLANVFVDEVIHRVCMVEDIPADTATQLSDIFEIIISRLPQIYQEESDARTKVINWEKIKEMILILNGSLKDIENRWCDGAGVLAIYFTPDELRNLIRALFQNTTYRANLLSKIK